MPASGGESSMAGKPKVLKINERKRPRVVKEEDYSLLLEKPKEEGKEPEHVVFKGMKGKAEDEKGPFPATGDKAADKLRSEALKDLTPLEKGTHFGGEKKEGENPLGKRVKKFLGMQ